MQWHQWRRQRQAPATTAAVTAAAVEKLALMAMKTETVAAVETGASLVVTETVTADETWAAVAVVVMQQTATKMTGADKNNLKWQQ